ncbi:hypothetical protein PV963_26690 [Streptomyces coeruleorubidus]|uniref:hypothetical protein n=1 Tax=Streptomyces coeruleorubidus TaxID=116188 RepID=UPI00237FCB5D|nr:hypothetical protein [Streptomyces coeruleorubidus]WDV53691.1 hypothetical protein PV963_26690 [Streptomyces coeruleorubidus]
MTRAGALRGGLGMVGVILGLVVGAGVILLVMGLGKRFAREAVPVLVDLPGGAWTFGGGLGVVTVLGVAGWLRCASGLSDRTRLARGLHAVGTAVCCAAAFGPFFLLLSGLPGRNCRSESCAYIPGTGSAFLAYALSAGLVGWSVHRWTGARAAEQAARERERIRRLRKKGKGKSRAARQG